MDYDGVGQIVTHFTKSLMTIRLVLIILAVAFPVTVCFVGCTQQTPEEKAAATDKVLQEIGVAPPKVQPAENAGGTIPESAAESADTKTDEVVSMPSSTKPSVAGNEPDIKAIKPIATVDNPKTDWIKGDKLPRENWELQYLGSTVVGFMHRSCTASQTLSGSVRHEVESRVKVSLKGVPHEQRVKVSTLESKNGEIITIECTLELGANTKSYKGRISQGQLKLDGLDNGKPFSVALEFRNEYRGPFAVEQSMLRRPLQPKETRKLKYFDPILMKVVDGRLEASDDFIMTPVEVGGAQELLEVRNIASVGDETSQSLLWVDKNGEGLKSYFHANDILAFRTDPTQAKLIESGFDLRAAKPALIPLTGAVERLTNMADLTSIRYRVSYRDEPYRMFTDRIGQRITSIDPRTVEVTVYQNGRELNAELESGFVSKVEPAALEASPFIPVNSPQIEKLAQGLIAADKSLSPEKATVSDRAYACQREIQKRVTLKEFDYQVGTVSNSIKTKQANCIEHACLFASVCRSLKIPTRIALGVKYNRSAEKPAMKFHAWIEVRDGALWVPMDSSDDAFPTSIDRIKIQESYFDSENPLIDILRVYRIIPDLGIQVLP